MINHRGLLSWWHREGCRCPRRPVAVEHISPRILWWNSSSQTTAV